MSTMPFLPSQQPVAPPNLRDETITDAVATIIQTGYINGKTSYEIASEIVAAIPPVYPGAQVIPERDSRDSLAN